MRLEDVSAYPKQDNRDEYYYCSTFAIERVTNTRQSLVSTKVFEVDA